MLFRVGLSTVKLKMVCVFNLYGLTGYPPRVLKTHTICSFARGQPPRKKPMLSGHIKEYQKAQILFRGGYPPVKLKDACDFKLYGLTGYPPQVFKHIHFGVLQGFDPL